jgi:hypothetical protein
MVTWGGKGFHDVFNKVESKLQFRADATADEVRSITHHTSHTSIIHVDSVKQHLPRICYQTLTSYAFLSSFLPFFLPSFVCF